MLNCKFAALNGGSEHVAQYLCSVSEQVLKLWHSLSRTLVQLPLLTDWCLYQYLQ